ncbi:MAG: sigma-70 family RNA polymerase sigma factor [Ruminococcus sp.]|uniref:RNA polymerase sigma factor n=1 Tax=Ruminococcus flavefaciens TaxID=1265 RepID=UPI001568BD13|nr:sigma-70 region 4 domain-containing protein [Ruminococcus flavefaciens]MBR0512465.1 sigma-70 family RNA polymerase sigma factor [Ruminococcus sp.]
MARNDINYSDKIRGKEDSGIKRILGYGDKDEKTSRLRSILLKIINNELTPRQKEIIMLYYFKGTDIASISERLDVSQQAVYAAMARARNKIYSILKYYI